MIRRLSPGFVVLALTGPGLGCASVSLDPPFGEVQEIVHQRSGHQVEWNQPAALEEAAKEKIRARLREELTAEDAVAIALVNNRRLQATLEDLGIARADQVQAGWIHNPVLTAEIRFPDRPFEVTLVQSLLSLFQARGRRKQAAAAFESVKLRVGSAVLDLVAETRAAFYDLQAAEGTTALRRGGVEAGRASVELAALQHQAGNISDLDLENEQAMVAQAELALARSELQVLARRERLNVLMGLVSSEETWKAVPDLPDPPPEDPGPEALESLALAQRLDLASAWQEVEAASRARPLARAGAIGEYGLGVHREREPEGTSTTGPEVVVPVPLFHRGGAARARAEAVLIQARHRHAALAVEIRAEVRSARDRMNAARVAAEYYRDVLLPQHGRIVALSQRHYNYMLLSPIQLLMARHNEFSARAEYIEAVRDYWTARSDLQRAIGGTLPSPGAKDVRDEPEAPTEPQDESRQATPSLP